MDSLAHPPSNDADATFGMLRDAAGRACALLRVLAHDDRLILLCRLAQGECTVGELQAQLGIVQPTLSQQLGVLRREGLVSTRRDGKRIHYRIASEDALALMHTLHARFCAVTIERSGAHT